MASKPMIQNQGVNRLSLSIISLLFLVCYSLEPKGLCCQEVGYYDILYCWKHQCKEGAVSAYNLIIPIPLFALLSIYHRLSPD